MLSGDILYLDYREYKVHFPAHRFILLGFDEKKGETYIADRINDYPETCSMGALRESRNPKEAISTHNQWGKFSSGKMRHSLPEAAGIALRMTGGNAKSNFGPAIGPVRSPGSPTVHSHGDKCGRKQCPSKARRDPER